jgi:hypothetical protein
MHGDPGMPPQPSSPATSKQKLVWVAVAAVVAAAIIAAAIAFFSGGVRSDLSARDQELCGIVLDDDESIGYLSGEVDELIERGGTFSSEGDAYGFQQVPVQRSERELSARIANYGEPDSAGFIDDPELLSSARALRDEIYDLGTAADGGGPIDEATLTSARGALDDMAEVCTG